MNMIVNLILVVIFRVFQRPFHIYLLVYWCIIFDTQLGFNVHAIFALFVIMNKNFDLRDESNYYRAQQIIGIGKIRFFHSIFYRQRHYSYSTGEKRKSIPRKESLARQECDNTTANFTRTRTICIPFLCNRVLCLHFPRFTRFDPTFSSKSRVVVIYSVHMQFRKPRADHIDYSRLMFR